MDAGLRDDAAKAKGLLINEIQRGDTARGGQTVSPNLKDKGDERLFRGAKEAIKQGLMSDPSDIEVIADKLSAKQVEELNALMSGAGQPITVESMLPIGPAPDLNSAEDSIYSLPEFQAAGTTTAPTRVWEPQAESTSPGWGGGAIPQGIADWFKDNVSIGFGDTPSPEGARSDYVKRRAEGVEQTAPAGLPPDMGLPLPGPMSTLATPEDAGLLSSPQNPIPMGGPATTSSATPAEDPIIELAGSAGSKSEALAIADEAEASGIFPGARAKVMKAFGWDEEGAQDFGRALMGFGSGLLSGGPDFGAALGNAFSKGAGAFVDAKDDRRQAALDDRRIAMEDERLDFAREEMNDKRKQAALDRLSGEAAATQSGLIYYEDGEGRIRSRKAPLQDGPQDEESLTDLERYDYWMAMPEDTPAAAESKRALGRKWGFVEKTEADPLAGMGV